MYIHVYQSLPVVKIHVCTSDLSAIDKLTDGCKWGVPLYKKMKREIVRREQEGGERKKKGGGNERAGRE